MEWPEMMWLDNEEVSCCSSIVLDFLWFSRRFIPRSILLPHWKLTNIPSTFMVSKMIHFLSKWSQKSGRIPWFSGYVSLYFVLRPAENLDPSCPAWRLARAPWRLVCVTSLRSRWMRIAGVVCCSKRVETIYRFEEDFFKVCSFFSSELQTFIFVGILVA